MKFDKIVGFGDSFMWGDELLDPDLKNHEHAHPVLAENTSYRESRCFLGRLGEHYRVPTENFGIAGGSLQSTIWTYLWWLDHEPLPKDRCLVLVALTDSNRHSFYNPRHTVYDNDPPWNYFEHSAWIHWGASSVAAEWADMVKRYMVLTDSEELCRLTYRQAVLFFQGQSSKHSALIQFNTIFPYVSMSESTLVWPDTSLQLWLQEMGEDARLTCPLGHPNEKGHELIAQRLTDEIDRAIIRK